METKMKTRGYERLGKGAVIAKLHELREKKKALAKIGRGLSCRELGLLDYCRNVVYDADYYTRRRRA